MSQISLPFNTHTFNTHNGKHVVFYGQRDNWGEGSLPIRWHDGEPVMGFKVGRWLRSFGEYMEYNTALASIWYGQGENWGWALFIEHDDPYDLD